MVASTIIVDCCRLRDDRPDATIVRTAAPNTVSDRRGSSERVIRALRFIACSICRMAVAFIAVAWFCRSTRCEESGATQ